MSDERHPDKKSHEAQRRRAYQEWLDIPAEECPPNHYQLLGLEVFESDMNWIQSSVNEQLAKLRDHVGGKTGPLASELAEEIKQARRTLLNADTKSEYDDNLQSLISVSELNPKKPRREPKTRPLQPVAEDVAPPKSEDVPSTRVKKGGRNQKSALSMIVAAALGSVTVFGGFWLMGGFGGRDQPENKPQFADSTETSQDDDDAPSDSANGRGGRDSQPAPGYEPRSPEVSASDTNTGQTPNPIDGPGSQAVDVDPARPLNAVPVIDSLGELANVSAIEIPADRTAACRIGPLEAGAFILVQYADGKWSKTGAGPGESPDADEITPQGGRLVITEENAVGTALKETVVLPRTETTPYIDQVGSDGFSWKLEMQDEGDPSDNTGAVRYRIAAMRPAVEPLPSPVESPARPPVPAVADLRIAETKIRTDNAKQLKGIRDAKQAQDMAKRFLSLSRQAADPVERCAYLNVARELALESGGLNLAFEMIREIAVQFDSDEFIEQSAAIREISRKVRSVKQANAAKVLAPFYQKTVAGLLENAQFDEAAALANDLSSLGLKVRDSELRKIAGELADEVESKKQQFTAEHVIDRLMKEGAANASEHAILGKHLAFTLARWDEAIPHLAQGDDAKLKTLAESELAKPKQPKAQEELADAWREYEESLPESAERSNVLRRAGDWYLRAEALAKGEDRLRITKQLQAMGEIDDLLKLIDPAIVVKHGDWQLTDGVLRSPLAAWARIQAHYLPPEEYHVTLQAQWQSHQEEPAAGRDALLIGLSQGDRQFMVAIDWDTQNPENPFAAGFVELDQKPSWSPATKYSHASTGLMKRDQENRIDVYVKDAGVTVEVNGEEILHYDEGYDRLGLGDSVPGIQPKKLFLGTHYASYRFTRFEVRRVVPELE